MRRLGVTLLEILKAIAGMIVLPATATALLSGAFTLEVWRNRDDIPDVHLISFGAAAHELMRIVNPFPLEFSVSKTAHDILALVWSPKTGWHWAVVAWLSFCVWFFSSLASRAIRSIIKFLLAAIEKRSETPLLASLSVVVSTGLLFGIAVVYFFIAPDIFGDKFTSSFRQDHIWLLTQIFLLAWIIKHHGDAIFMICYAFSIGLVFTAAVTIGAATYTAHRFYDATMPSFQDDCAKADAGRFDTLIEDHLQEIKESYRDSRATLERLTATEILHGDSSKQALENLATTIQVPMVCVQPDTELVVPRGLDEVSGNNAIQVSRHIYLWIFEIDDDLEVFLALTTLLYVPFLLAFILASPFGLAQMPVSLERFLGIGLLFLSKGYLTLAGGIVGLGIFESYVGILDAKDFGEILNRAFYTFVVGTLGISAYLGDKYKLADLMSKWRIGRAVGAYVRFAQRNVKSKSVPLAASVDIIQAIAKNL